MSKQRVVTHIPNPPTTFVLGSRHWDKAGFAGISGITNEHILFHGKSDYSTVTVEAPGQVVVHSTGSTLTAFSEEDFLVGTQSAGYISAKERLFIAAGAAGTQHPKMGGMFTEAGPIDAVPESETKEALDKTKETVELALTISSAITGGIGAIAFILGKKLAWAELAVGVAQVSIKLLSMFVATENYKGDLLMYGAESATLSSAKEVSIASLSTVSIMTPQFVEIFAGIKAGMVGFLAADVTGGFSSGITGGVGADVTAGYKVDIQARRGQVEIKGKAIDIGSLKAPFPQKATQHVTIEANKDIKIVSGKAKQSTTTVTNDGISINGKSHSVVASDAVNVEAGTYSMRVGTDGITIARSLGASVKPALDAAQLTYDTAVDTAKAAFETTRQGLGVKAFSPAVTGAAVTALITASIACNTQIKAAKAILDTKLKTIKSMAAAVLRLNIGPQEAHLSNGIAKIAIDKMGRITIDGGAMPITIKSGPSTLTIGPDGIKAKPMVTAG